MSADRTGSVVRSPAQVARLLRDARQILGLGQLELASRIGINQSAISRWERANHGMTVASLLKTADALGYDLALIPKDNA